MNNIKDITDILKLDYATSSESLPHKAGVYFILDKQEVLYIGKATSLKKRGENYKHYFLINKDIVIYYFICNKNEIGGYENKFIKKFKPKLNKSLVEDPKIPLYPVIHFRVSRKTYQDIFAYCKENNITISEKSRLLWEGCDTQN